MVQIISTRTPKQNILSLTNQAPADLMLFLSDEKINHSLNSSTLNHNSATRLSTTTKILYQPKSALDTTDTRSSPILNVKRSARALKTSFSIVDQGD